MNVIVVILDSLRKDHVGCYGETGIQTPNLDKFARKSVRFTKAFPESLPTLPVRRALYTGLRTFPNRRYVPRKGDNVLIPGWEPLPENQRTISEIVNREGYLTALYSSVLHMFKPAMNYHRGFDCWTWIRGQEADRYMAPLRGSIEDPQNLPCDLMFGCVGHSLHRCLPNMQGWTTEKDWFPARTFNSAAQWLERNYDTENFFLMIDEFDPHEPWTPPKPYLDQYFNTVNYDGRRIINTYSGQFPFRAGELEFTKALYAGEVTFLDTCLGFFFEKVTQLDLWENTVIVLLSDHGHPIMEHGILHKLPHNLYPELMDLVFLLYHPHKEHAGTTCDAYVSTHDVAPTLLALLGIEQPAPMEGRNIWDWVTRRRTDRRVYQTSIFGSYVWCRDEEYAYIADLNGKKPRLYNVQEDPAQVMNIATDNPMICDRMYHRVLADAEGKLPHYPIQNEWYDLEPSSSL
jgi:arylsulfatase A-like enzyme